MASTKKTTKQQNFTGTLREKVFLDRYALKNADGSLAEHTPEETWARVAWGIAQNEKPQQRKKWEKAFYQVMEDFKFVPGGRILSGAGTNYQVTYFNCFVVPSPKDSRDGILESLKQLVEIQSRSGGVGLNLSSLRPKGARVKKVNGTSSGPVTWAGLFSYATHDVVQQGGCFSADTQIMTHRGLVPMQDIVEQKGNWYAATHDGYQKITTKFNNGKKMLYEVKTQAGFSVKTTAEHRFVTVDKSGHFYLKKLAGLTINDPVIMLLGDWVEDMPYVVLNTHIPAPSKFSFGRVKMQLPTILDEKLAFFIGAYDADGSKIKDEFSPNGKGLRIVVAKKRPKDLQTLLQTIKDVFGVDAKVRNGDGAVDIVQIFSREINEFLQLNGLLKKYSVSVEVPQLIFSSPRKVVEAYIAGVFFGEGSNRGGKGGLRITTVSEKFASQLQLLLLNLGIAAKIAIQDRTQQNWRTLYTVTVNGNRFMKRFAEALSPYNEKVHDHVISNRDATFNWPFNLTEKFVYLSGFQRTIARTNMTTSQKAVLFLENRVADIHEADREDIGILASSVCDTIASITPIGEENVYDLEVENVHLLSGNGFYTSNSRRGATMLMLWDWHPDVEEFITVKEDLSKINGANLSVCVSDAFMKAVKEDKEWDLVFPDISDPDYDAKWNGEIDQWIALGKKVKVYKTVKARKLWDLICTAAWRSAEPGLHFMQRSNERSNTHYFERLVATNPCLTGNTLVATKNGWRRVDEIKVGETIGTVLGSGVIDRVEVYKNRPVFKVKFSDGAELRATAAHQFHAIKYANRAKNSANKRFKQLSLAELEVGDIVRVASALMPNNGVADLPAGWHDKDYGFFVGVLLGDGCITEKTLSRNVVKVAVNTNEVEWTELVKKVLQKTGSKIVTFDAGFGHSANLTVQSSNGAALLVRQSMLTPAYSYEKQIPLSYQNSNEQFLAGLLDGLFSTDGNIDLSSNHPFLRFKTTSKQLALDVRRVLLYFGIHGRIATIKKVANSKIDDRVIISKHQQYEVIISGAGMKTFAEKIGLSHPDKQKRLRIAQHEFALTGNTWLTRIVSIEPDGIEDVYDLYEPVSDTWITEGIVSRGCGEQPLGPWAVCNLGAMNLSAYVKDADLAKEKGGWFDFESFGKDVQVAIRFLDNVIDKTYYFFRENEKCAKDIRRTGLGIMGLGDALIKMQIPYGSKKSIPVLEKIFKTLRDNAYEVSSDIAKEKGSFPKFDNKKYLKGYHIRALPKQLQQKIGKQGIRNAVLLTIAPTGTTSLVSGVSSGIEPVYEFSFLRRWRGGEDLVYHPLFEEWKKTHPNGQKPDYFVSANDLTPLEHVSVQAVAQEYIDSSISKTVNAPNSHTVEDVKTLYMLAYDMGLKGITYMRDGSRQGVLERIDDKKPAVEEKTHQPALPIMPVIPRPARLEGTTYQTETPVGKTYITINRTEQNEPFEVFITIGKSGSDVAAMADALGRMISLNLRLNGMLPPRERIRQVVSHLTGIGGARSVGFGINRVRSLPDAVAKVLAQHFRFTVNGKVEDKKEVLSNGNGVSSSNGTLSLDKAPETSTQQLTIEGKTEALHTNLFDICPECGVNSFAYEEGCKKCYSCGYAEC